MHERQRGFEPRIAQVLEIVAELRRQQHALVDERARRQRDDVETLGASIVQADDAVRDHLAQDEQAALERVLIGDARAAPDEHLTMRRLGRLHGFAETGGIDRHIAPAEETLTFLDNHLLDDVLDQFPPAGVARQEQRAGGVIAGLGQFEAQALRLSGQESMRRLDQHAAAVAGLRVRPDGAAMIEIEQDFEALLDDRVGLAVLQVGHEADAAGVTFGRGIVHPLRGRKSGIELGCGHDQGSGNGEGSFGFGDAFGRRALEPHVRTSCVVAVSEPVHLPLQPGD